jgi:excisionase family DNA binding protein
MILNAISNIISAASDDLAGAKILDERLLTIKQLAVLLGVSERMLRRMEDRGSLPSVRVGGETRYSLRAIEAHWSGAPVSARDFK